MPAGLRFVPLLVLMLGACASETDESVPAAPAQPSAEEVAAEVREAFAAFDAAVQAEDWPTAGAFYADSRSFRWWEDGQLRYESAADARAALEGLAAYGPVGIHYGTPDVMTLGPDAATLAVTFETTVGEGDRAFSFSGLQTLVLRRQEAGWVASRGHSSTLRPAAEADHEEEPAPADNDGSPPAR